MSTYLGQNFLKDSAIRSYIGHAIAKMYQITWAQVLIEIWPGKWAITKKIYALSDCFFVVEKDLTMQPYLEEVGLQEHQILFWDILEVDLLDKIHRLGFDFSQTLVVWNLPYYITSPIFRLLFGSWKQDFLGGIFMIQDEVWLKIISDANKKSYLWRLLNWGYEVSYLKMVPAKCFSPVPKVKSCLVAFSQKSSPEKVAFQALVSFLNVYAPFSRKTLGRIQKMLEKKSETWFQIPEHLKSKRLEELDWEDIWLILQK